MERWGVVAAPRKAGRWAINKLDPDGLEAAILISEWDKEFIPKEMSAEVAVLKLVQTLTAVCDVTMPWQYPRRKTGDV